MNNIEDYVSSHENDKKYLYIGVAGVYDVDPTFLITETSDWREALVNVYHYGGGKIKTELFEKAIVGMEVENAIVMFEKVSNDKVWYFGMVDGALYDKVPRT